MMAASTDSEANTKDDETETTDHDATTGSTSTAKHCRCVRLFCCCCSKPCLFIASHVLGVALLLSAMSTCSFVGQFWLGHFGSPEYFGLGLFRRTVYNLEECSGDPYVETSTCKPWTQEDKDLLSGFDVSWYAARALVVLAFLWAFALLIHAVLKTKPSLAVRVPFQVSNRAIGIIHIGTGILAMLSLVGLQGSAMCEDYCHQSTMSQCLKTYKFNDNNFPQDPLEDSKRVASHYCFWNFCQEQSDNDYACRNNCNKVGVCPAHCHLQEPNNNTQSFTTKSTSDANATICSTECYHDHEAMFLKWCNNLYPAKECTVEYQPTEFYPNGNGISRRYGEYCYAQTCNTTRQAIRSCQNLCSEKGYCQIHCDEMEDTTTEPDPESSNLKYETCTEDCMEEFCLNGGHADADTRFCESVSCTFGYGAGFVVTAGAIYLLLGIKLLRQGPSLQVSSSD